MGISRLWDVLGDGEVVSVAHLATEHFKSHGRPLRIAIDAAGWKFKNLTPAQVAAIREKEPAANPVEKAIFHRVIRLMRFGIHPLFVFDGPCRPWKHGKSSGGARRIREDAVVLRQILNAMRIPHHEAPGEAEAECAALQLAGIVDATWSDDGDALMFGCTTLIRDYREEGKREGKSTTEVRLYKAADIRRKHRLDRQGLMLFVILSGGDYEPKGLPGCCARAALKTAQSGLGRSLWECQSSSDVAIWRQDLREFFQSSSAHRSIYVPDSFPRDLVIRNYRHPIVSTADALLAFTEHPSRHWSRGIDEQKLRHILAIKFNIQGSSYAKHMDPIFFVRSLMQTKLEDGNASKCYQATLVKQRNVDTTTSLVLKVRILPREAMCSSTQGADDTCEKIECETLQYLLRQGLPGNAVDVPPPKQRKKRSKDNDKSETSQPPKKLAKKAVKRKTDGSSGSKARRKSTEKQKSSPKATSSIEDDLSLISDDEELPPLIVPRRARQNTDASTTVVSRLAPEPTTATTSSIAVESTRTFPSVSGVVGSAFVRTATLAPSSSLPPNPCAWGDRTERPIPPPAVTPYTAPQDNPANNFRGPSRRLGTNSDATLIIAGNKRRHDDIEIIDLT